MYRLIDIDMTLDGDINLNGNGDVKLSTPQDSLSQEILFRVKTERGDYVPQRNAGAGLSRYQGEPNIQPTLDAIVEDVHTALTIDGFIPGSLLFVDAVPISINEVALFIMYTGLVFGQTSTTVVSEVITLADPGPAIESITNATVL